MSGGNVSIDESKYLLASHTTSGPRSTTKGGPISGQAKSKSSHVPYTYQGDHPSYHHQSSGHKDIDEELEQVSKKRSRIALKDLNSEDEEEDYQNEGANKRLKLDESQ